jgi:DNA-binding transcriptional LysR family regulator
VSLTDAGAALLPEAHAALDAVRAARDAVRGNQGTLRGAIDIGSMTAVAVMDLPALLLVPTGHRLASRRRVALHELADEEFVDFPPGSGSRDLVDQAFTAAGVRRRVSVEADIASAAAYVRCGLGITLLPEFAVPDTPDLSVLAVGDETLRWTLSIATSSTRRPSAPLRALLELADAYASTAPGEPDLHDLGSGDRKSAKDHKE